MPDMDATSPAHDDGSGSWDDPSESASDDPSPHERLERAEVVDRVLAALDRLPAKYRVPLTLYHIEELSIPDIAAITALPAGTIKSHLYRSRLRLRELLETPTGAER